MNRYIDADKYRKDLLSAYDDVSIEFEVLDRQPLVQAIPLDEVKQAREKTVEKVCMFSGSGNENTQAYCDGLKAGLEILDKLMEGVEDKSNGEMP